MKRLYNFRLHSWLISALDEGLEKERLDKSRTDFVERAITEKLARIGIHPKRPVEEYTYLSDDELEVGF